MYEPYWRLLKSNRGIPIELRVPASQQNKIAKALSSRKQREFFLTGREYPSICIEKHPKDGIMIVTLPINMEDTI